MNKNRDSSESSISELAIRWVMRWWYWFLQHNLRMLAVCLFQYRCYHADRARFDGPALFLSNHQSVLDPIFIGIACHEPLNFIARRTLFRFPPFRWLILSLDAIPINREGMGLDGIKETLRRLKKNKKVVLFPEGRRTSNGQVAPLRPGFCAMARRGPVTIVPLAIDGAFDAWPRSRRFPRPGAIHVYVGLRIDSAEIAQYSDEELVRVIEVRIRECHALAQKTRQ